MRTEEEANMGLDLMTWEAVVRVRWIGKELKVDKGTTRGSGEGGGGEGGV